MTKSYHGNLNAMLIFFITIMLVLTVLSVSSASSNIMINSPTILSEENSIQLPSGSQIYLYGAVTGGAYNTGHLAYSDKGLETVIDASGNIAAQLAVSSSNQNSFQTNCAYYAIGGVGISGFNSYNTLYGYNNSPGATQTSVHFTLSEGALVVIIALASGGLNYVTAGNIPGLSTDASDSGGSEGFVIGHAYLTPGNYVVTISATSSSIPGAGNMVVLAGVYEFFASQISPVTQSNSNVPLWAFNGSYADYNLVATYDGYTESIPLNFNISQVNSQSQTFKVSENYGGAYSMLSGTYSASFGNPSPFPAVSPSDLAILKTGKAPTDMAGAQVKIGLSISVPAGSFNVIEINNNGEIIYIDSNTGLIVEENGGSFGSLGGTLELTKTNIQNNSAISFLWITLVIIIIIVIMAIVLVTRRKSKSGKPKVKRGKNADKGKEINDPSIARIKMLKELHDKGLINDKEYEEQKGKIIGNK